MVNWETIDKLREIFISKYLNSNLQSELEKACSEEYELKRDYNGRQILELLQNVDDACEELKSHDDIVVKFSYTDGVLEVGNTGTTFSAETIERLCLGRASEKSSKKIGNKGTGFRSLLNDAEWIEIHSGKFAIRFSEKFTQNLFNKYCNEIIIATQLKNWKKDYDLCFPIMNCPEEIAIDSKGFDTLIRVKIKSENELKETSIQKQLEQPFYKSLLFLPNITKIVIETSLSSKEYSKISDNNDILIEEKIDSQKTNKIEEYFIYSKKDFIDGKEANLIIAIPKSKDYDFSEEKLYCYFPIRNFNTPIHALIHAPFSTNNSRDDVPDDDKQINRNIFILIIKFISEIAENLSHKKLYCLSIKTVIPIDCKLWSYNSFNLRDKYFEILSVAKILPTVNKKLISIRDEPKIFDFEFPEEFCIDEFSNLLIKLDTDSNNFIKQLACFIKYSTLNYSEKELSDKINIITVNSDIKTRIKLFLWWNKNIKSKYSLPNLIQDTNNEWILVSTKVYLPTDGGVSVLPKELSWVKLCILKQEYVSEIISQLKSENSSDWEKADYASQSGGDKRTLATFSREHFSINFIEQSSHDQIISTINQQIESVEESIYFINWFFERYGKDLKEGSELSKVKYKLPSRESEIIPIDKLYLGKEYSNCIAEKLFQNTDIKPLAGLNIIYKGKEKDEFILFLKKCGIYKFPKIYKDNLWNEQDFRKLVSEKYVTDININYLYSKTITNFKNIFKELTTKEIVEWLDKDEMLNKLIKSKEMDSEANQNPTWYPKTFLSNAYIKFVLNTTPWIELDGIKYPPCRIIKYDKVKNKVDGFYGISEQELTKKLGKEIAQNFELDFKDSLAQLHDKDIRLFLDKLPSFDSGEISRKLYLDIIKFKKGQKPSYSVSNIQLLCKDRKFYPNTQIKYADRKISKTEESNGHFISIHPKQSTETIQDWLGVERYKTRLKLENYKILENKNNFDSEIKDIKISLLCIIDQNKKNIDTLKRIDIIPCTEIEVRDLEQSNNKIMLEDFFFVENDNSFYIKIPNGLTIPNIRVSDYFSSSLVDIFKQALTLSLEDESNLIELLISKDLKAKKIKIEDLYGVDKWNTSYELLYNRNFTNEQVRNFFHENELEQELLAKTEKIDFANDFNESDYKIIIQSLKKISKDVVDLNCYSETLNVNLIPFFESEIKKLMNSKFEKYRSNLYIETKSKSGNKSDFLDKLEEYKNFDVVKFGLKNSVSTNIEEILCNKFPILKTNISQSINPDKIYNENVEKIILKLNITKGDFDFFIQNNKEHKSVIYFEIEDSLYEQIDLFLSEKKSNSKKDNNLPQNKINSSTIQTKLIKPQVSYKKNTIAEGKTEKSQKDYETKNAQNDTSGKSAEEIAYNELKKNYKNLIWHSKYSQIPADRNNPPPNGVICDMWDFNPQTGNSYFEVKSAVTEFELSINEYRSMEKNKDSYEVVLVNRNTQEISRHKFSELEEFKQINSYMFKFMQEKIS